MCHTYTLSDDDIGIKEVIVKRKKGHKNPISLAKGFTLPSDTEEDSEDDTSDCIRLKSKKEKKAKYVVVLQYAIENCQKI